MLHEIQYTAGLKCELDRRPLRLMWPGTAVHSPLRRLGKASRRFELGQAPRRVGARSVARTQWTLSKKHLQVVFGGTALPGSSQSAAASVGLRVL